VKKCTISLNRATVDVLKRGIGIEEEQDFIDLNDLVGTWYQDQDSIEPDRYRDFMDPVPEAVQVFRKASRICVPFVAIAELSAGFAAGNKGRENERVFEHFLHREHVEILIPTMETSRGGYA